MSCRGKAMYCMRGINAMSTRLDEKTDISWKMEIKYYIRKDRHFMEDVN